MKRIFFFLLLFSAIASQAQYIYSYPTYNGVMTGVSVPADLQNGASHSTRRVFLSEFMRPADSSLLYTSRFQFIRYRDSIGTVISAMKANKIFPGNDAEDHLVFTTSQGLRIGAISNDGDVTSYYSGDSASNSFTRYSLNGIVNKVSGTQHVYGFPAFSGMFATTPTDSTAQPQNVVSFSGGRFHLGPAPVGGSFVPQTRTITINGTTYDLSQNRSWTIATSVGSVAWGNLTGSLSGQTDLQAALDTKVDKVTGKGLSTNDYDNTEKAAVAAGVAHAARTDNPHSVTKAQVGLNNVDNTSDASKPVSTATQTALNLKANQQALVDSAGQLRSAISSAGNATNKLDSLAVVSDSLRQYKNGSASLVTKVAKFYYPTNPADGDYFRYNASDNTWRNYTFSRNSSASLKMQVIDTATKRGYWQDIPTGGNGSATLDSLRELASDPATGNIYKNTVSNRIKFKSGGYWYTVAVTDSSSSPVTSYLTWSSIGTDMEQYNSNKGMRKKSTGSTGWASPSAAASSSLANQTLSSGESVIVKIPSTTTKAAHLILSDVTNPNTNVAGSGSNIKYGIYTGYGLTSNLGFMQANALIGSTTAISGGELFKITYGASITFYKSTDGGTNWTLMATASATPSGTYYIVVQGYSTLGGFDETYKL